MAETSALSTAVMESLDGVKVVKIDNREAFEEQRVAAVIDRRQRHIIKGADARATAAPATETLMSLITAVVENRYSEKLMQEEMGQAAKEADYILGLYE
jgi:subfamily B ATP-binding cassette protein MsbA